MTACTLFCFTLDEAARQRRCGGVLVEESATKLRTVDSTESSSTKMHREADKATVNNDGKPCLGGNEYTQWPIALPGGPVSYGMRPSWDARRPLCQAWGLLVGCGALAPTAPRDRPGTTGPQGPQPAWAKASAPPVAREGNTLATQLAVALGAINVILWPHPVSAVWRPEVSGLGQR